MRKRRIIFDSEATPSSLMHLNISGINRAERKEIRKATEWMLTVLVGARMAKNLDVNVRFVPNLGRFVGDCEWLDENISPRQFLIRISSSQSTNQRMMTLAHELIHVKQFVTNQLFDYATNGELSRWHREIIDASQYSYRDLPWEKDAYATQAPLLRAYKAWMKRQHK